MLPLCPPLLSLPGLSLHNCISVVLALRLLRYIIQHLFDLYQAHWFINTNVVEATATVCHGTFQGHTSYISYVQSVNTSAFANKLVQIEFRKKKWTSIGSCVHVQLSLLHAIRISNWSCVRSNNTWGRRRQLLLASALLDFGYSFPLTIHHQSDFCVSSPNHTVEVQIEK